MATVKFLLKGDKNPSTVLVRFTNGRKQDFKRSTSIQVNPDHWNNDKGELRRVSTAVKRDQINSQLQGLKTHILETFNEDHSKGKIISSEWLKETVNKFNDQEEETDLNLFTKFAEEIFIKEVLPQRENDSKGNIRFGVEESTVRKYKSIINKVKRFEQKKLKTKLYFSDIDLNFRRKYLAFLRNDERLADNTVGRQITFIKTICKAAQEHGIKTHPDLAKKKFRGFSHKINFIYLTQEEIERIENHQFTKGSFLDNARDWLVVGLHTGQRISDFMKFTNDSISGDYIEFYQKKTGANIRVPINESLRRIIEKHDGGFPRKISHKCMNEYIKIVCEKVGIDEMTKGNKYNPETKRKEPGTYPKYELVKSRICRRSFATNHYGIIPTPVIMAITGHTTEKMLLNYIGKSQDDHAKTLKEYYDRLEEAKKSGRSPMEVVKGVG